MSLFSNKKANLSIRLLLGLMMYLFCPGVEVNNAMAAETEPKLSKKEKRQWVEQAVVDYKAGNLAAAKDRLERVEAIFKENYAIPYYLGLIYLEEGHRGAAISQWQRYLKMDAKSENTVRIHKYLTILLRAQAVENARRVVNQKTPQLRPKAAGNAVVVTPLENKGLEVLGPLGKGLAAMLIADLSQVPNLDVVGRIELQALFEEMELVNAKRVDTRTALELGKLLRKSHVTTGSLRNSETENMQLVTTVFNITENTSARMQTAEDELSQFYELEKEIACDIVHGLGKNCDKLPENYHKIHTRSLAAFVAFSWGLDHFDKKKYDQARDMFQKALEKDPDFELAQKALLTTPTSAMAAKSSSQIIADVSSMGKSPASAGSAIAGRGGVSKTTMIVGGLAIAGGGAALVGGGGSSGSGTPPPDSPPNVSGVWRGAWTFEEINSVNIRMTLEQSGASVSGNIRMVSDWECMPTGDVTNGSFKGNSITLILQSSSGISFLLDGTCTEQNCSQIEGTWSAEPNALDCTHSRGGFSMTKRLSADGLN